MKKKVYLDANVLVAHQIKDHKFFDRAKDIIESFWRKDYSFVISSLTIDEFLYAVSLVLRATRSGEAFSEFSPVFRKLLRNILSWQNIELVSFENNPVELAVVLDLIRDYNLRPRDAFHLRIMQQQGVNELITFDSDFWKAEEQGAVEVISNLEG